MKKKNISILVLLLCIFVLFTQNNVNSQDDLSGWDDTATKQATPEATPVQQVAPIQKVQVEPPKAEPKVETVETKAEIPTPEEPKEQRSFFFFKKNKEIAELEKKQKKEKEELKEKVKKDKADQKEKAITQKEELKKKLEVEEAEKKSFTGKLNKYKQTARNEIYDRNKAIRKIRYSKRFIEVITNENDPIYIKEALVLDSKTNYLKIRNVEYKYKLELLNQTPKIINSALIIWERKIPFTESLTIMKETKISKPIVPYEKRIVEYNDLNSKREGESYRVKIAKILFEDGTQWKNPAYKETKL